MSFNSGDIFFRPVESFDESDTNDPPDDELSPRVVLVCFLCFRQYDLEEDLRGHMIEYHKYRPIHDPNDAKSDNDTVTDKVVEIEEQVPVEKEDYQKPLSANPEMKPMPFKDFRLILRSNMSLKCHRSSNCVYKFENEDKLKMHLNCHIENKTKFQCFVCAMELENWRRCSAHLWKVHQQDVDLLQCPNCEFKSHASALVWRHMRVHKKWRPRVLRSLKAVKQRRLEAAKQTQEPPRPPTPKLPTPKKNKYYSEKTCEICERKFVNGKTLSKHIKTVHNKIKPFNCNICGKKTARKASLIIHMRQHTGEKPLSCKSCKFSTRDPSVLHKHQMRHERVGKLKCSLCDYSCIQSNALKRHIRLKHSEYYKQISCDLCNFVTIDVNKLKAHREDHRKGLIVNSEDSMAARKMVKNNENKKSEKYKYISILFSKHFTALKMPAEYNLKLQDLAQIALGTTELNNINIALLQSLIEILLKKLNCENEEVSLNVYDAKHLENMLKSAKLSPLAFNDENVEIITPKLERLDELQRNVKKLDEKVSKHLEDILKKSNFNETAVSWESWSSYGCEDLCTTSDPENEMACRLLKNADFLKKLLRRLSSPMVNRMFHFEDKISKLNEEFSNFIRKAEEEFLKIQLLGKCIVEIDALRETVQENQTQFLNTMEEIQDMLDSKLDKIHMPALKKYITDNFKRIDLNINRLNEKKECQQAAGIVMDGIRCVSCGNAKVCSAISVPPTSILPDISIKPQKIDKQCGRMPVKKSGIKSLNLGDVIDIKVKKSLRDVENAENDLPTCRKAGEDFDLVEGVNGHLYRRG